MILERTLIKNIIIGKRSNLSKNLFLTLDNAVLISSEHIEKEIDSLKLCNFSQINIIFNQFQPAKCLLDISDPVGYIEKSIGSTARVLRHIDQLGIDVNKILYTSSCSVYSHKENILSLHSVLKLANEKLLELYAKKHDICLSIMRVYNIYGGDDSFSIISRMVRYLKGDTKALVSLNVGDSLRDYIHVSDVCASYKLELEHLTKGGVVDVGTGLGTSINEILSFLKSFGCEFDVPVKINKKEVKTSLSPECVFKRYKTNIQCRNLKEYLVENLSLNTN